MNHRRLSRVGIAGRPPRVSEEGGIRGLAELLGKVQQSADEKND